MTKNVNDDIVFLHHCVQLLVEKQNWGRKEDWTNQNFKELSNQIHEKTGTSLSVSSIRRLLGLDKSYKAVFNPQMETKNALAKYLDYENWADFKTRMRKSPLTKVALVSSKTKWSIVTVIAFLCGIALLHAYKVHQQNKPLEVYLSGKNLKGQSPHTIAFHYDVSKVPSKRKIDIDFGEYFNTNSKAPLIKDENIITHTYTSPYYYTVKVMHNEQPFAFEKVMVKSNGWVAGAFCKSENIYLEVPFSFTDSTQDGVRLPYKQLARLNLDTLLPLYTEFKNVDTFKLDGDDFALSAEFKCSPTALKEACLEANFVLLGENKPIMFKLVSKGCEGFAEIAKFGDYTIGGKYHDLKSLSHDFSNTWTRIELLVKAGKGIISIDHHPVFTVEYSEPIGEVYCLHLFFTGKPTLRNVRLLNSFGETVTAL